MSQPACQVRTRDDASARAQRELRGDMSSAMAARGADRAPQTFQQPRVDGANIKLAALAVLHLSKPPPWLEKPQARAKELTCPSQEDPTNFSIRSQEMFDFTRTHTRWYAREVDQPWSGGLVARQSRRE